MHIGIRHEQASPSPISNSACTTAPRRAPTESYTRKLLDKGVAQCAKKFGEEAVETVLAAVQEDQDRLIAEAADVLYHLLVVLQARGITLAEVEACWRRARKKSGLEEKASRATRMNLDRICDGTAHRRRRFRPTAPSRGRNGRRCATTRR